MYEHVLAQLLTVSDDDRMRLALSPFVPSAVRWRGFFSSYQPQNRCPSVDGVTSASGLPVGKRKSNVFTHSEFIDYADVENTRLRSGENPLVDYYKNVKFLF